MSSFHLVTVCDAACSRRAWGKGQLTDPNAVAGFIRATLKRKDREYFGIVLLDARQRPIELLGVSVGTLSQVEVHPRELFREAIRRGAHSVILTHNHPSGDPTPSDSDIEMTNRMTAAGQLLGIPVLDHVIVAPDGHTSLASLGLVPRGNPKRRAKKAAKKKARRKKRKLKIRL